MIYYKLVLPLLQPLGLSCLLLTGALLMHRRRAASRLLAGMALLILLLAGNHFVAHGLLRSLERRVPTPAVLPSADAIILASGGLLPHEPPRRSVELNEAGDRTLYAARLYKAGLAPNVLCGGGALPWAPRERAYAEDEVAMLTWLGVPREAIWSVPTARTTREEALHARDLLKQQGVKRALLVTSALHMPRTLAVFRATLDDVDVVPAPTDFRATDSPRPPLVAKLRRLIPNARDLDLTTQVAHEYLGLLYYRLRGWLRPAASGRTEVVREGSGEPSGRRVSLAPELQKGAWLATSRQP